MKLALGPAPAGWQRPTLDAFYARIASAPVDIVHVGGLPALPNGFGVHDWLETAYRLGAGSRQVIIDSRVLTASSADVATFRRVARERAIVVEANDMGAVQLLADHAPFVAGPGLDVYNAAMLGFLVQAGATRWTPPREMGFAAVEAIIRAVPSAPELEVQADARLLLDFAPACAATHRCGDARRHAASDSMRLCCLVEALSALRGLKVRAIRVRARHTDTIRVLSAYRAVLDRTMTPREARIAATSDPRELACPRT